MLFFVVVLCLLQIGFSSAKAQKPVVSSFCAAPLTDMSAAKNPRPTIYMGFCALLRVHLPADNVRFSGLVEGDIEYNGSTYYVYMSSNATALKIDVPGYSPCYVKFEEFSETLTLPLLPKATYDLVIDLPTINTTISDLENSREAERLCMEGLEEDALVAYLKIKNKTPADIVGMANCYLRLSGNKGIKNHYDRYDELYRQAAELGESRACWYVASKFEDGSDWDNAIKWWKKGAEDGDLFCISELGRIYAGLEDYPEHFIDDSLAFKYFLRAAESSPIKNRDNSHIPYCQYEVGIDYLEGITQEKDFDKAYFWLSKSAEGNYRQGIFTLGECFKFGLGVDVNLAKAYTLYEKAAEMGCPQAYKRIGLMYLMGEYLPKNETTGMKFLLDAAELFDAWSVNFVGECYLYGDMGFEKNEAKAFDMFLTACAYCTSNYESSGIVPYKAFFNLGHCYECGIGTEVSLSSAISWYKIGKKLGEDNCRQALIRLGE